MAKIKLKENLTFKKETSVKKMSEEKLISGYFLMKTKSSKPLGVKTPKSTHLKTVLSLLRQLKIGNCKNFSKSRKIKDEFTKIILFRTRKKSNKKIF